MKILVIGKVWPEPSSSAAGKRMQQLLLLLKCRGEVHFACANQLTGNEIDFSELEISIHTIELNSDSFDSFLVEMQPDVVLFDRFITEEQYSWRVMEKCPDAIRIINTEDLHFLRKTRQQFVKTQNTIPTKIEQLDFHNDDTMRELACILRSDFSIMISQIEMELLVEKFGVKREQLLYLPLLSEEKQVVKGEKDGFLFVGNVLHEPNLDAIRILRKEIWPKIRKQLPQAKLRIVGAYPTHEVLQMNSTKEGIEVIAHPKSLEEIYAKTKVSLVPLRFGAGVKGKIIEAMEYGVPFVTTTIGAEGLQLENQFGDWIHNDWDVFTQKSIELFKNSDTAFSFSEHLAEFHDKEVFSNQFLLQFDHAVEVYQSNRKSNFIAQVLQHHSLMSTRYLSKWIIEKNK